MWEESRAQTERDKESFSRPQRPLLKTVLKGFQAGLCETVLTKTKKFKKFMHSFLAICGKHSAELVDHQIYN